MKLIAVCVMAVAVVVSALSFATAAPPSTTTMAATATSPTSIDVSWVAEDDAHRWWVIVTAQDDRSVAQRTACGSCRQIVVDHLAPSSAYFVRVVGVDPDGSFGAFPWPPAVVATPPASGCEGVTGVCVTADTRTPVGEATGVGLGSLHGITHGTDPERVRGIEPTAWRVSGLDYARVWHARSYGGSVTAILSDPWMNAMDSMAPWDDWAFYEWFIGAIVDGHIANNALPDYWDVQNEPQYSAYKGTPATAELVFEQYRRAAAVIRTRLPDAKVVGPSPGYVRFGSDITDVDGFVERSAATGTDLSGISWHEIGAACLGHCDGSPRAVLQHADDARAALAAHPQVADAELHVNEWGAPWNFRQPGAAVGYLSSLAYAGIDVANPACWNTEAGVSTCFADPGMLDGLLLEDGTTPTDAWFTHHAFAQMTGEGVQLLDSTFADPEASVVATADGAGTVHLLLGRHTGCQVGVDEHCPGASYAPPKSVQPVVMAQPGVQWYSVTVERIPSVPGALAAPTVVEELPVTVVAGRALLGPYDLADGEAISIRLEPQTTAPASPLPVPAPALGCEVGGLLGQPC